MKTLCRYGVLLAAIALARVSVLAQVPGPEQVPVKDPDRLEKMGFDRDARNVYVWSKADLGRASASSRAAAPAPESWGTAAGYTTVPAFGLQAERPEFSTIIRDVSRARCNENTSPNDEVDARAVVQLPVPDGARLTLFQYWGYDTDPDLDLSYDVYETCQAPAPGLPFVTLIAHAAPVLADGQYFGSALLSHLTADTKNCVYSVRVLFAPAGHECVQGGLEVEKLQVAWVRQVSPAPATATFNDVPTSHPFFQFVEALAKSGITGGCNAAPPLYCPDQPLTRGQMAVFLAKALGLQWP